MNIGEIKEIKIETIVHGGEGLGHIDGQVVFVAFAAPDDKLLVRINAIEPDFARAEIVEIIEPSPSRVSPTCEVFGDCGGCQWQHIHYDRQLALKMDLVSQALRREGKIAEAEIQPIICSPQELCYRHRMQFSVNHRERRPHLGLYKKKTHDLTEMKRCYLAHPLINSFLKKAREVLAANDNRVIQGIDVTLDGEGKKILLVLHFKKGDLESQKQLYEQVKTSMPEIVGVILKTEEYKKPEVNTLDQQQILYPTIDYQLFIGPETFIQVNKEGNKVLVQTVLDLATEATGGNRLKILEMHSGAGNFTLPLSKVGSEIIGVESSESSVELARKGLWMQDITNCQLLAKSDFKGIKFLLNNHHSFDMLVVDPPRPGCKEILEYIPQLGIKHIIYVSCNPPTLARDLAILLSLGYQINFIQPIDMFPQTHHVECVVRLEKIKA